MRVLREQSQFNKDMELLIKRGTSPELLKFIGDTIEKLRDNKPLHATAKPHPLFGKWKSYKEIHVNGNLILIYKLTDDELILVRIGDHSQLFKR